MHIDFSEFKEALSNNPYLVQIWSYQKDNPLNNFSYLQIKEILQEPVPNSFIPLLVTSKYKSYDLCDLLVVLTETQLCLLIRTTYALDGRPHSKIIKTCKDDSCHKAILKQKVIPDLLLLCENTNLTPSSLINLVQCPIGTAGYLKLCVTQPHLPYACQEHIRKVNDYTLNRLLLERPDVDPNICYSLCTGDWQFQHKITVHLNPAVPPTIKEALIDSYFCTVLLQSPSTVAKIKEVGMVPVLKQLLATVYEPS